MKRIIWKNLTYIFIIIFIFSSVLSFYNLKSYADNIKVVGDKGSLKVILKDTRIFNLNNLNPGDSYEAEIGLENKYTDCYLEIYVRAERASQAPKEGEADLFKQLKLKVYLHEVLIYSGDMEGFATINTSLGTLQANKTKDLRAVVHLPGAETGNEFQDKDLVVNWIFTVEVNCSDPEPDPEPEPEPEPEPDPDPEPEIPQDLEEEVPGQQEDLEEEPDEDQEATKVQDDLKEPKDPKKPISKIAALAQTGATPDLIYFGLGSLILAFGRGIYKKKE